MSVAATTGKRAPTPPFTEAHEELRMEIREWIAAELYPHAARWDAERWFPSELFADMARAGFLGMALPAEYGGRGDYVAAAVLAEELARCGSGGLAAGLGAHQTIALPPIAHFGTDEQKERWVRPGLRGEKIAALGITEPDAGSDVAGVRTRAVRTDGGWIVNGSKLYITGGVRADVIVCACRTTPEGGHQGMSFLLVERGPGVESRPLDKLGWHASDTALITFDDVFVPEENLLGQENKGFYLIMANFQWERLAMALGAVGAIEAALDRTLSLLRGADGQWRRHRIAEIALKLHVGRDLTYQGLRLFLAGENAIKEVTMAKLYTQRAAYDAVDSCLHLVGPDDELERALCDARLGPIGGGTDEVMKEILGKMMGL